MSMNVRRQQIEDAASVLFSTRGYAGTSMRDIARLVDLQGGSLYAHVTSKEDVLWAIVEDAAERFHAAVGPIATGPGSVADRLAAMARAHLEVITSSPDRALVFLYQWTALGAQRRARVAAVRDAYERYFRDLLAEGVASGELPPADPRIGAFFVLSVLNGVAMWYRPDGPLRPDEIARELAGLCLRGLAGAHGAGAHEPSGSRSSTSTRTSAERHRGSPDGASPALEGAGNGSTDRA